RHVSCILVNERKGRAADVVRIDAHAFRQAFDERRLARAQVTLQQKHGARAADAAQKGRLRPRGPLAADDDGPRPAPPASVPFPVHRRPVHLPPAPPRGGRAAPSAQAAEYASVTMARNTLNATM